MNNDKTTSKTKLNWKELLKSKKANIYFKPTRYMHDSGFRCFEVGYLILGKKNRVKDKLVLGQCSDHLWMMGLIKQEIIDLSMDLTKDGYIRIFSHKHIFTWDNSYKWVVSTAEIEIMKE